MLHSRHVWTALVLCLITPGAWAGKEYAAKPGEQVVPNQLLVKLKTGASPASVINAFLQNAQMRSLGLRDIYLVNVPGGIPPAIATLLAAHGLVDFVEPNRVRHSDLGSPNDPYYSNSISPPGEWGLFQIQALQAWSLLSAPYLTAATAGTNRIKVAVLDSGADCTHPDFINAGGSSTNSAFGGQLLWTASQAFTSTTIASPACAWQDDHGHGTHVAGIVAAATSNGVGMSSLGYPLQVIVYKVLDKDGSGSDVTISNAIVAAADAGSQVISMSLGGAGYSQTLQSAINYAWQKNSVVVAAAGNSATSALFFRAERTTPSAFRRGQQRQRRELLEFRKQHRRRRARRKDPFHRADVCRDPGLL